MASSDAAPRRGTGAAGAGRRVGLRAQYTRPGYPAPTADPGSVGRAGELAALADGELLEQARLLAELPPAMTMWVLARLRLLLAELARRLAEREEAAR